ncbi:hypothetical protein MUP77_10255 [Candidatus Bathyarchaeota archaeon]|nr:hypothetical protein [Candidatus Bathyarchaeota archaeon]
MGTPSDCYSRNRVDMQDFNGWTPGLPKDTGYYWYWNGNEKKEPIPVYVETVRADHATYYVFGDEIGVTVDNTSGWWRMLDYVKPPQRELSA